MNSENPQTAAKLAELGIQHLTILSEMQQRLQADPETTLTAHVQMTNEWLHLIANAVTKFASLQAKQELEAQLATSEAKLRSLQSENGLQ